MILTIVHRTVYRYARPVALQAHRMMLCPRGQHDLKLLSTRIECTPTAHVEWTQDVFGNPIATANFEATTDVLTINSSLVVDQCASEWPIFTIAPSAHSFPFSYSPEEAADLGAFRTPHYPDAAECVREWVSSFRRPRPTDTLSLLKDLNTGIARRFAYASREEEGTQAPDVTIRAGSGSCRDLATLFIEAVRMLGFGARAVSGYLQPADEPGSEQHGSTHAWAEVYLPCAGWIAFDPTNARMGSAGLIPVAVARTIEQIRPIQGSYTGGTEDFLTMSVSVAVSADQVSERHG